MLTADEIAFYRENGYLMVEDAVNAEQLERLREITYGLIEKSRAVTESDAVYDLDEGHSAERPRLTRIKLPHKQDPYYWEVLKNSRMTGVLTDLLGPDTMIQTSKLNTKAPGGGAAVEWHQDWAFYPHTNDDMLAFGLMLEDVDEANGPLQVIPGTHKGPVLSHHAAETGLFCGAVDPEDPMFDLEKAVTLTGKAGAMTVHHVRTLHGSAPNLSDRNRLILFYECRAADAWPLVGSGSYAKLLASGDTRALWEHFEASMITGEITAEPRAEAVPMRLPLPPAPDAGSIFKTQKTGGARSAFTPRAVAGT
ncbi:phytanoyl-CoA dioxygenase family protein [Nisaea acidiphila]|uniref:Phytanoyl-CoA dioxygenase family protein n=1 Tax=Nisaea acidiphila TaxID=1862145 RepID=A0A9J7APS0_9PROT|nr:phytanoyl-CoA dioxygenase family protein [Nisaea acidiphila]UUX49611.1 phytanoyl-CoA dioxygenase family protein [Nisaea acidiphila]